jgi:hypothetical protein
MNRFMIPPFFYFRILWKWVFKPLHCHLLLALLFFPEIELKRVMFLISLETHLELYSVKTNTRKHYLAPTANVLTGMGQAPGLSDFGRTG